MIVDDLEVSDGVAFRCCAEMDLRLGFAGPLCVNGEVSGFSHFNACKEVVIYNLDYYTGTIRV